MHRLSLALALILALTLVALPSCTVPSRTAAPSGENADGPRGNTIERVYHVQIGMDDAKSGAEARRANAMTWWDRLPAEEQPWPLEGRDALPIQIVWQTPFYRVRVGPFVTRDRAAAVLDVAREQFPDAFIAPERVAPPS